MALKELDWLLAQHFFTERTSRNISEPVPKWYIIDTSGFLYLAKIDGNKVGFTLKDNDGSLCVMTDQVFQELNRMYESKRRDDLGNILCPYTLINNIYQGLAEGSLVCTTPSISERDKELVRFGMKKGQAANGKKVNSRVSEADISLIVAAQEIRRDAAGQIYPVITGSDSDIPSILIGTRCTLTGYLPIKDFKEYLA